MERGPESVHGGLAVHFVRTAVALACVVAISGCERFPKDPRHGLSNIRERGTLRVGVADSPPWIRVDPETGEVTGVEADIVASWADELGVGIEWYRGGPEESLEALKRYELDLFVGGLTEANPWKKHVGFTLVYYKEKHAIGVPAGAAPPEDLEGMEIAVHAADPLAAEVRARGGDPIPMGSFEGWAGPVAAATWELETMGLDLTPVELGTARHVMAAPPGENALIMHLEDCLLREATASSVERRLKAETDE